MQCLRSSPARGGEPRGASRGVEGPRREARCVRPAWNRRVSRRPLHHAAHGPPPRSGEELASHTIRTAALPRRPSISSVTAQTSASARSGERPDP